MDIEIRAADAGDIDTLVGWRMRVLREVFGIAETEDMSDLREQNRLYYLSELPRGGHIACFAYVGGKIAGCGGLCVYREMPSPDNPDGLCGYLMNIYTLPGMRGHGVGRAVVGWLVGRAKEKNISKIYLETTDDGKELYKSLGFGEMENYMKLRKT